MPACPASTALRAVARKFPGRALLTRVKTGLVSQQQAPSVQTDAEVREVDVLRIGLMIDEWETPWSHQHGSTGWLFRGYFLDTPLKKGEVIDLDASWLERCELRQ